MDNMAVGGIDDATEEIDTNMPKLVTVKVDPVISSGVVLLDLALSIRDLASGKGGEVYDSAFLINRNQSILDRHPKSKMDVSVVANLLPPRRY